MLLWSSFNIHHGRLVPARRDFSHMDAAIGSFKEKRG